MGKKKGKNEKKIKGAEKTAMKTEKKAERKLRKDLKNKGEDDIEALIAEFQEKDRKRDAVVEEKCSAPSPRCNMTLTPNPDKDELLMFGGEYFNGSKTFIYNDLYLFNTKNHEWSQIKVPNAPPPRCSHQAVALSQGGGQLWIFGGEFASPTQSQFYHYKDFWVYHMKQKKWDKVQTSGGPSARSGHRMVVCRRQIIVFGGFHDNLRDYKYFNDLHAFNLDTFTWTKLVIAGSLPQPRSGCQMAVSQDRVARIIIYGGYSKERIKKDVDKGKVHVDMFVLTPEGKAKDDPSPSNWKCQQLKQSGAQPSPRCGFSMVATPGNRAIVFGGVFDEEEDDENVQGKFFNEMYNFELDKGKWHDVVIRKKKDSQEKKRRRKKRDAADQASDEEESEDEESEDEMEEGLEKMKVEEKKELDCNNSDTPMVTEGEDIFKVTVGPQSSTQTYDDGIFTVSVGGPSERASHTGESCDSSLQDEVFMPCPRMNALMAIKHGILYLFGGFYEEGDKQITLADMYSLDLHKLDQWNTIIACDVKSQEWMESESSSDEEIDETAGATGGQPQDLEEDDSESTDSEEEESDMEEDIPVVLPNETSVDYFERCKDFWLRQAEIVANHEGIEVSSKKLKKAGQKMAEEYFQEHS